MFAHPFLSRNRNPMKSPTKLLFMITTCSLAVTGCGSRVDDKTTAPNSNTEASVTPSEPTPNVTQTTPNASPAASATKAEVEAKDFESTVPETRSSKVEIIAQSQAPAATAFDATGVVNLLELPRINEKSVLQNGTTYLFYSGKGTLTEAERFYQKLLESRGWKEVPPLSPPTEQFVDLLFEKKGYYLQASLSVGSERGEIGVMLANLGNVDVRSLPKLPDADVGQTPSTPVNFTYKSNSSIQDAADAVSKQMTENGWQPWNEFYQTPEDVPHYRTLHFRKEACRLNVGVVKNPQDPADKTTVFYHAEYVTPFDIPTPDASQALKLDLNSGRASFPANNSRTELVSLLRANSQKFGWKIGQTEKFESGEEHRVPINVESGAYVVASLMESGGKYFGSIEGFASAPKTNSQATNVIATNDVKAGNEITPPTKDPSFDILNAQINSTIQAEISKALGSVNSPTSSPKDLAALEAMANELASKAGIGESRDDDDAEVSSKVNPFDIPEDPTAPAASILSIKKTVGKLKHAGKTYELPYVACYAIRDYDEPTKCIIFSDSPIDIDKLKRELLEEGKPIYGNYVSEKATNVMSFRINEYMVSVDANIGNLSMGIATTKIKADVSYYQGKIAGKIITTDPIDVGGSTLEFSGELNQPALQIDWAKHNSTEAKPLVVDEGKDCLIPEGCSDFSSEGSRYSKKIEATIKAPLAAVQSFYTEQLESKGWKATGNNSNGFQQYRTKDQELDLKLESLNSSCKIEMQVRNAGAAKEEGMLPPVGKAMLVLGNLTDAKVQMTIDGKAYQVAPSDRRDPKDATKVIVEPGSHSVQVTVEKGSQKIDMKVDAVANSTWGVLFDTSFHDVLRLF